MSWYSDGEPFDEYDDPYCEQIHCEGGDSYEQCRRCLARVYGQEDKDHYFYGDEQ